MSDKQQQDIAAIADGARLFTGIVWGAIGVFFLTLIFSSLISTMLFIALVIAAIPIGFIVYVIHEARQRSDGDPGAFWATAEEREQRKRVREWRKQQHRREQILQRFDQEFMQTFELTENQYQLMLNIQRGNSDDGTRLR